MDEKLAARLKAQREKAEASHETVEAFSSREKTVTATFGRGITNIANTLLAGGAMDSSSRSSRTTRVHSTPPGSTPEHDATPAHERRATISELEIASSTPSNVDVPFGRDYGRSRGDTALSARANAIGEHLLGSPTLAESSKLSSDGLEGTMSASQDTADEKRIRPANVIACENETPVDIEVVAEQQRIWDAASRARSSDVLRPSSDSSRVSCKSAVDVDADVVAEQERIWNSIKSGEPAASPGGVNVAEPTIRTDGVQPSEESSDASDGPMGETPDELGEESETETADARAAAETAVPPTLAEASAESSVHSTTSEIGRTISTMRVYQRPQAVSGSALSLRGFLKKRGGTRVTGPVWHSRFVVLENGILQYYLNRWEPGDPIPEPKSTQPLSVNTLKVHAPARLSWLVGRPNPDTSFELETQSKKAFFFIANSMREMQQWVTALRNPSLDGHDMRGTASAPASASRASDNDAVRAAEASALSRQPQTQLEASEAAALQEYNFLHEAMAALEARGKDERSPEAQAFTLLIDCLHPFLEAHQLVDTEVKATAKQLGGVGDSSS